MNHAILLNGYEQLILLKDWSSDEDDENNVIDENKDDKNDALVESVAKVRLGPPKT